MSAHTASDERAAPEPVGLSFTPAADAGGTDFDVLMGYQLFLGRDPESSFVIADAKTSPVGAFLRALMGSGEFHSAVLDRLAAGRNLPHESASLAPSPEQMDWLFRHLSLPSAAQAALRGAPDWREWLHILVAAPGFPHSPGRGGTAPAAPDVAVQAADDGFVLVHLEQPKAGERLHPGGLVSGNGWAIAPADVAEVAVHLDDTLLSHARYGLPRPDVARSFPHYRHVDHCGFAFTAEIPAGLRLTATSQLVVSVRTVRGELGRKSVRLQLPAEPQAAAISGAQDGWPIRLGVDDAVVDGNRTLRVRGWAASQAPLRAVTAMLGDTDLGRVTFGLPRADIARLHAGYPNAGQSGFAIVHRLPPNLAGGPGFVRVQAEDELGQTRHTIVPLALPGPTGSEERQAGPVRGGCTTATLSEDGVLEVGGWTFAERGPASAAIELDGETLGVARTGLARPDIARLYPGEAAAARAGFTFSHMLDEPPAAGPHRLTLIFVGAGAEQQVEHRLVAGQAHAPQAGPSASPGDMRLEIDHPILDDDVARASIRGALAVSGWAVARHGVAGVSVFSGEALLGHAHCGMRRADIGSAFPDYEGALLAGYALVLPPGTLPPGRHTIRIAATEAGSGAATMERRFSLTVAPYDALPADGTTRTHIPPAEASFGLRLLRRQGYHPAFHITVGSSGDTRDSAALIATLRSLLGQAYPAWTATLHLPGKAAAAHPALRDLVGASSGRIVAVWPGRAPTPKVKRAGDGRQRFVMRLRAGDRLGADALLALAAESAAERDADFIYADELRADPVQNRRQPFFKPDWSPDLLLAMNYVGRAWCATHALAERAGLAGDASDYDAVLRLTEAACLIGHVPRVLFDSGAAPDSQDAEAAALAACLARRGIAGQAEAGAVAGTWRVRRSLAKPKRGRGAKAAGRVSIIMPTCGARGLVQTAIGTIRATTSPAQPVELIVLDNTPASEAPLRAWIREHADTVIDMPAAFNWSHFNNAGARAATGDYLVFLNDDIEITQPDWLAALLEHAQRPEVGVVGARLLYPDGKVQHAGQYLADTHARHAFRFADRAMPGPFGLATVAREVISVTGACQMMRAEVFHRLGGFEEAHSVVNNDVDFCLRIWQAGLSVVFTPHATLTHHELASRAALADDYDEARFIGAWSRRFVEGDPFRNPHLAPDSDDYAPDPEPAMALHVGRRGPAIADVKRILAIKLDHIGDFLTALPAIRQLALRFPAAKIDLLAPAATAELARHEPAIAETIVFDFFHAQSGRGQKGLGDAEFQALRARLAPAAYDLAIDLRMQPETRVVMPYTGAAFLAGYDHANRFGFLDVALEWEGDAQLVQKRAHVSERLVQMVSAVEDACRDTPVLPGPAVLAPASVPALAALPAAFLARPLVCVHPGVGNPVRQWPPAHYAALIDLLAGHGLHAVLVGGPDEAPIAEEVLRRITVPGTADSLVGQVKLAELASVMRACVLFVGNNSGPQHLAASLGIPAVGIHSGVVDAAEWAPQGAQALAIRRRMVCSPCYLEFAADCPRDLACLTGLRPAQVFAACRRLLA